MKIIQIELEDDLHQKLKVACAKQRSTLKDTLQQLINNFVNTFEDGKKEN